MNIIFTDIDGVLNPSLKVRWDRKCINVYNRICDDFDLHPVITSTWRLKFDISELQDLFFRQGISADIYDYTPYLRAPRGLEIDQWLIENSWTKYVVIDDRVDGIIPYVSNVIKCRGWVGLTDEHYDAIKKIMNYGGKR